MLLFIWVYKFNNILLYEGDLPHSVKASATTFLKKIFIKIITFLDVNAWSNYWSGELTSAYIIAKLMKTH